YYQPCARAAFSYCCRCPFLRSNMLTFGFFDPAALWSPRHKIPSTKRETTEWEVVVDSHVIVSLQGIIQAYKSGITLQGNTTSLGRWDYSGSFFFSISAITTIGYGNLSPSTAVGRIFCIVFALFGIPLNLVLLNEIGQLMLLGVQHCARRLEEVFHWQNKASFLMKTCALVTGLLLFLLLPPLLFSDKEGWSYEEGFYYSFITLSTIGFGDYVIGMNPDRTYPGWYKNVISLWILFGMAWLALVIKFCIHLLESSSDFCQCNKKSTEMSQWFQHFCMANINKNYINLETH
uniref:Potassium two pore domain channel subfamily K member 17 n=1 Tax=Malurus cyaneus samueli TaxID=2593467 RepID=A0A8C5U5W6_9PASS